MQKKLINLFELARSGIRIYKIAIIIAAVVDTLRMYPVLKLRYYLLFYLVAFIAGMIIDDYLQTEDREIQKEAEKEYVNYTFHGNFDDWCNLPRSMRNRMHNCEFIVYDCGYGANGKVKIFKQLPDTYYTVQKGDTLNKIAKKFETDWKELAELNNMTTHSNAPVSNILRTGQKLVIKRGEFLEL